MSLVSSSEDDSDSGILIIPSASAKNPSLQRMDDVSSDSGDDVPIQKTKRTRNRNQNQNQDFNAARPARTRTRGQQDATKKNEQNTAAPVIQKPPAPLQESPKKVAHKAKSSDDEYQEEEEKNVVEKHDKKQDKMMHLEDKDVIKGTVEFEVKEMDEKISVRIPEHPLITSRTYAISRKNKISIKGSSYTYTFLHESEVLYSAKCKGRIPSHPIPITRGGNVHISSGGQWYLIPDKGASGFVLKKDSITGAKVMGTQIMHNIQNIMQPRTIVVEIMEEAGIPMMTMVTRKPKMSRNGTFTLDFHNRFTIPSEKNAIFYNQAQGRNGPDIFSIRKIGKDTVEIIADLHIPDFVVFASGLCIFTGNLAC